MYFIELRSFEGVFHCQTTHIFKLLRTVMLAFITYRLIRQALSWRTGGSKFKYFTRHKQLQWEETFIILT
jgi:hypothetical protein